MQRILWLAFCLLLTAGAATQTNAARHRDDGFNPMGIMSDMFDSSERRRDRRHYRPPPPRPAPAFGYGGYPAYARPPASWPPYAYPRVQQAGRPIPGGAIVGQPGPQAKPVAAPTAMGVHTEKPQNQTPGYSFRPVPPTTIPTPPGMPGAQATRKEPAQVSHPPAPSSERLEPTPESKTNEPILFNGKPAVFRPMDPGSTNSP